MECCYAHSVPGLPVEQWHRLEDHLRGTATLAEQFASAFDSGRWGYLAGLWHDLGKYLPEFQKRLLGDPDAHIEVPAELATRSGRPDHSTWGALHAMSIDEGLGLPLAFVVAGHHAGLSNREKLRSRLASKSPYLGRLKDRPIPQTILEQDLPLPPGYLSTGKTADGETLKRRYELWVRFLYSALVDADFLDTEKFVNPEQSEARSGTLSMATLLKPLEEQMQDRMRRSAKTAINDLRRRVWGACWNEAMRPQGVFSLTVPTGGGKTLASMGFALRHAIHHGLQRVIVVLPYTTIIEQNAAVYRSVFGDHQVLEHHSNVDPADPSRETRQSRLASENWDAPVIVTTNVQFFESLFANRSSRCRKLHNIARSVVILDEAQALPTGILTPILSALQDLTDHFGMSLILSTATQPALKERGEPPTHYFPGLKAVHEIAPDPGALAREAVRVDVRWAATDEHPADWKPIAEEILAYPTVLVVVHRRKDARDLTLLLPDDTLHLSALMCPAHRASTLNEIKSRLAAGRPCRVVSTQLVEAGVDIDFPVVFRALAGLDSLAQSAGRCNREGKLMSPDGQAQRGLFRIFVAPTEPPRGILKQGLSVTYSMLEDDHRRIDIHDPTSYDMYFRRLFSVTELDSRGIQRERADWNFEDVAKHLKVIEEAGQRLIAIPYQEGEHLIARLRRSGPDRFLMRALQRYIITVYEQEARALIDAGAIGEFVSEGLWVLESTHRQLYNDRFGLVADGSLSANPEALLF